MYAVVHSSTHTPNTHAPNSSGSGERLVAEAPVEPLRSPCQTTAAVSDGPWCGPLHALRAVTLVVLDAREATLSVELQHFVRRVEAERAGAVVAEVAARVHPVSRELLVVLGVALLERRRHGEAVGERVVPLAAHAVEGEQEAGRAVQRLVGVVAQLLRRVVRVGGAARGRDWRALGWGT